MTKPSVYQRDESFPLFKRRPALSAVFAHYRFNAGLRDMSHDLDLRHDTAHLPLNCLTCSCSIISERPGLGLGKGRRSVGSVAGLLVVSERASAYVLLGIRLVVRQSVR